MNKEDIDFSLYLVTDRELARGRDLTKVILAAVKGGVSIVQLREKNISTRKFVELSKKVKRILAPKKIPLLINDRIDVALAVDADGVHIGQNDMNYEDARRILGKNKIIGYSVESIADAQEAEKFDCDYLGLSPVFSTLTKTDIHHELRLEGVRQIRKISHHKLIGIGGLNAGNCAEVIEAGADGIAVVSAICSAADPEKSAAKMKNIIHQAMLEKK